MVAVTVTFESAVRGRVTAPAVDTTPELLVAQVIVLPSMPTAVRTRFCVTLVAESPAAYPMVRAAFAAATSCVGVNEELLDELPPQLTSVTIHNRQAKLSRTFFIALSPEEVLRPRRKPTSGHSTHIALGEKKMSLRRDVTLCKREKKSGDKKIADALEKIGFDGTCA
jgi:hypothetical protein